MSEQNPNPNPDEPKDPQEELREQIKQQLLEDEEFLKSIPKEKLPKEVLDGQFQEGILKIAAMSKKAIDSHFGLTNDDKSTFSNEEMKNIDKYVAKAVSIYKSKFKGSDSDIAIVQDENLKLKKELEELQASIETIEDKYKNEYNQKLTKAETETYARIAATELSANIPVNVNLVFDKVFDSIRSKYHIVLESGVATIRKKDNPAFKVEKADKSGFMTIKDAMVEELKAYGAWKDNTPEKKPTTSVSVNVDASGKKSFLNDAIRKQMEEEERRFGAR